MRYIKRDTYNSGVKNGWYSIRERILKRDNYKCVFCGQPAKEVHHITPLSKGGTTSPANLVSICSNCHNKRHRHLYRKREK